MGLPKHIIKKYGVSKKAWSVYRASQKKRSTTRKTKKRTAKTVSRKVSKVARKRRRSSSKKGQSNMLNSQGARSIMRNGGVVLYGAVRQKVSSALSNSRLGQKFAVVPYADEVLMYSGLWGAGKLGLNKVPVVKGLIRSAKDIELARIGQQIADDGFFGLMDGNSSSTSNNQYIN